MSNHAKSGKNGDASIPLLGVGDFDSSKQLAAGGTFVAVLHVRVMQGTTLLCLSFATGVLYAHHSHVSAGTHKFKSAIQKSTLKKCEHTCRVNQVGCTQKSARVPKFCSIDIVKIKSTVPYFIGLRAKIKNECRVNFICFI